MLPILKASVFYSCFLKWSIALVFYASNCFLFSVSSLAVTCVQWSREREMTAERVDMATPDNLLFLDTDAVNSSLASPLIEQNKPTRATDNQTDDSLTSVPDQHPDPDSGSSGLMPVLCQDGTIEIHYTNSERENESGLVLTQPLDHTAMIEITKK